MHFAHILFAVALAVAAWVLIDSIAQGVASFDAHFNEERADG